MFESIEFKNFKALRNTTLPLSRFTLIVGPNGSGKSTALSAFQVLRQSIVPQNVRSAGAEPSDPVAVKGKWKREGNELFVTAQSGPPNYSRRDASHVPVQSALNRARIFSFDASAVASPVQLLPQMELTQNGASLTGVLDRLRDQNPERFDLLNEQLGRWMPEFDRVLFDTVGVGARSIALRTRDGGHKIPASKLSRGTLLALALLTLAFLPEPPSIVCLEEPDRGLHPRLLRDVRDALYRLAYPEGSQDNRPPVQVIATTHNPHFVDLSREHPEEIVIAEKTGLEASFSRLSDRKDVDEILGNAPLTEVWYSGVLGGVPVSA